MRKLVKYFLCSSAVLVLMACGGGDDANDAGSDAGSIEATALGKYIGSWSYCDQDHTRYSLIINGSGVDALNTAPTEVTYQNANCTGIVLGTYTWSMPARITISSTSIATVSGAGLPRSLAIDKIQVAVNNATMRLVGPGVNGNCIALSNSSLCYNPIPTNSVIQGGFYFSEGRLYELELDNGTYFVSGVYTKN